MLRKHTAAVIAGGFLLVLVLVGVFQSVLQPADPDKQDLASSFAKPSANHLLGADRFGRDNLSRLIAATPVTLLAVLEALALAVIVGVPLGLIAGLVGGKFDAVMNRITDGLLSLPPLVLSLAIVGVLGPGLTNAMLSVGVILSPRLFRVARAAARSVRSETYMEAARSLGASPARLVFRHILPNASSALLVQVSFAAGTIVTAEASLSFLGLGVQPPKASWGSMLRDAFQTLNQGTALSLMPGLMIVLTVLAITTLANSAQLAISRGDDRD